MLVTLSRRVSNESVTIPFLHFTLVACMFKYVSEIETLIIMFFVLILKYLQIFHVHSVLSFFEDPFFLELFEDETTRNDKAIWMI